MLLTGWLMTKPKSTKIEIRELISRTPGLSKCHRFVASVKQQINKLAVMAWHIGFLINAALEASEKWQDTQHHYHNQGETRKMLHILQLPPIDEEMRSGRLCLFGHVQRRDANKITRE